MKLIFWFYNILDVSFGAIVTLKNHRTGGGYLHSHWHLYPENVGAKQQQVRKSINIVIICPILEGVQAHLSKVSLERWMTKF